MVTAPKFTRELYKLLENLEVREKSEAMAPDAANEALIALERLPFAPDRWRRSRAWRGLLWPEERRRV